MISRGGYGGQTGGHGGRKDVPRLDAHRSGKLAGQLQRFALHRDAGHALGAVLIDLAKADAAVQGAAASLACFTRAGVDQQILLYRLGLGRQQSLLRRFG